MRFLELLTAEVGKVVVPPEFLAFVVGTVKKWSFVDLR